MKPEDYQWLTDHYIIYIDFYSNAPYLLPIDGKNSDRIDVMKAAGISYDIINGFTDIKFSIGSNGILSIEADGEKYDIRFSLDSSTGQIKLQKN